MMLTGKIALIAGGANGIGGATAALFRQKGATVIEVTNLDMLDTVTVARVVETVVKRHGAIDVLFLGPSTAQFVPIEFVEEDFFDREFDVNVRGSYFLLKAALTRMAPGGSVIVAWATPVIGGARGTSVHAGVRAALQSFGRHLAAELGLRKIRVNSLGPADNGMSTEAMSELASMAVFLASDASSFITGAELTV
jgi:NAD(P)-dependent dehydrogenase (short-subunit alcohol dehydrogenase family)